MATVADKPINILERFLQLAKEAHITIQKAFLFGSHAKGVAGEWSDIDIAIVSPDFSGMPFYDSKMFTPFLLKVDTRIEVHTFRPDDFMEDNEFIKEILKTGIELEIPK